MINATRRSALLGSSALLVSAASSIGAQAASAKNKLPPLTVSEDLTVPRKSISVNGSEMAYLELGEGEPVLFLHGNPTSSYLWRNVMPVVAGKSRAIAVDLIGMGHSAKPALSYSFDDHFEYVSGFIDAMGFKKFTLVGHDWGAGLAWVYAMKNESRVNRIAFMEGAVPPLMPIANFEALGPEAGPLFQALKNEVKGKKMVIEQNFFIEAALPNFTNRPLGAKAMKAYRAPYLSEKSRKPLLAWPREVPISGKPEHMDSLMKNVAAFMGKTMIPALFLYGVPGAFAPAKFVDWYSATIANFDSAYVGQGLHFLQEDQPEAIGHAIAEWIRRTTDKA